ncbi:MULTISPECIES: hypothetical protein [unclassified Brachybacterium]|uniref:hypothetical protein n=1 Tax=unclassified Brachybacterium TaxID=2623841 RepID=UPI003613B0EA
MSTPQQRVHDATLRLLELLESGDPLSPEAIELRAELTEATAEAGQLEDALYQIDQLFKDTRRVHGPDHETVARARRAASVIEEIAQRG